MNDFLISLSSKMVNGLYWLSLFWGMTKVFFFIAERIIANVSDTKMLYRAYAEYVKAMKERK